MGKRGKDKTAERFAEKEAFRLITGHMPVMMAYIDAGQKYRFANRAYEQWFDLPPGGCEGRPLEDVVGKPIYEQIRSYVKAALAGRPVHFEAQVVKNGEPWHFRANYFPNIQNESVVGFCSLITDLTEVRQAEEKTRQLYLDSSTDAMILVRDDGTIHSSNAVTEELFGYSKSELLGEAVNILIPDRYRDRHIALQNEYFANPSRRSMGSELRGLRKDGWEFVAEISLSSIETSQERLAAVAIRDVTERKQAEQALRDSEEQLRLVTDNVEVLICYVDADERFRFLSRAFEDWYGISRSEVIGKGIRHYFRVSGLAFDQAYKNIRAYSKRALAGERVSFEICLKNQDGDEVYRQMTYVPHIEPDGKVKGFFAQSVDITQRKRAEEALQKSEKSLIDAQRIAHLGSWEWDIGRDEITRSAEADRILGIKPEEQQRTRGYPQFVHPEDETRVKDAIQAALDGREPYRLEHRILCADGEERIIRSESEVVHDKSGTPIRMLGTFLDVTEQRRAEDEKRKLTLQIQEAQKFESLGTLAGGIPHDFNNLLAAILGNAELAQLELPPEAPLMENLSAIAHAAQRAADLTKQMLAYSGKGGFLVKALDLSRCVSEVVPLLESAISKKVAFKLDLAKTPLLVKADANQIRQVTMSLVVNASEALGENAGVITLRTGVAEITGSELTGASSRQPLAPGRYAYLEVTDTGCGIDEETQRKIFDPFFNTKFTGRGLGLAAVQGFVRGHDGAVTVVSEPGAGATFRVLLPSSETANPKLADPVAAASPAPAASRRILVVDDEEALRNFIGRVLRRKGFTVLSAADARQGLELFRSRPHEITAVLLDLTMPRMDGREMLAELRKIQPNVKVIVMSGYSEEAMGARFAGTDTPLFIEKPFKAASLIDIIVGLLD